jgi:hypothetical protein
MQSALGNIYFQKIKEMSNNDLEYTRLDESHRIMPTTLLANICVFVSSQTLDK